MTSDLLARSVLTTVRQEPAPGRRERPAFAALPEAIWGRSAGADDVLYIRLSGGVGGGRCACGGRGCLETYASVPAVLSACERALGSPVTLRRPSPRRRRVVHRYSRWSSG